MKKSRKTYPSKFKFQVALEATKSQHSLGELASRFEVSSAQISQWKRKLLDEGPEVFSSARARAASEDQALVDNLHRKIGELEMQLEWAKKRVCYEERRGKAGADRARSGFEHRVAV